VGSSTNGGTTNIVVGSANADTSYAGNVAAGGGSNPTFTKVGTATQTLAPNAAYTSTGTVAVNGGTLKADYANTTAVFNAASPLTFAGRTLILLGKSSGAT